MCIYVYKHVYFPYEFQTYPLFLKFTYFLATPLVYGSSQTRGRIQAAALTYARAVAMWDP